MNRSRTLLGRTLLARLARSRVLLLALFVVTALLPRSAGVFVLHTHSGHGLHLHHIAGSESQTARLDSAAIHASHHTHSHGDELGVPHTHGEGEVFLGLPSEPVFAGVVVAKSALKLQRSAPYLAVATSVDERIYDLECDRSRPPKPRGRVLRSGTRALIQTSSALLL